MGKSKILIIDDSRVIQSMLAGSIKAKNATLLFAIDGNSGKEMARQQVPDLILLDLILPDISGIKVCEAIKEEDWGKDIPIIFITSLDDDDTLTQCFEAGGVDFIRKPFRMAEVNARIETHLELARAHLELKRSTRIDFLTRLYNREHIIESIQIEIARSGREGTKFSLILGDIDKFKSINDTYGHSTGDCALKTVAAIMQGSSRKSDVVARWGGEEFMILAPNTDGNGAVEFAELMRKRVVAFKYLHDKIEFPCSITFGVKEYDREQSMEQNINLVDEALYQGKMQGRNRVVRI